MEVIPDAVVAAVVAVVAGGNAVRVGVPVGLPVLGFAVVGTSSGLAVGHAVSSGGGGEENGAIGIAVVGFAVAGASSGLAVGHAVSSGGAGAAVGIPVGFGLAAGEESGASGIFVVGSVAGVGPSLHSAPRSSWHVCSRQHAHRVGYSLSSCRGKMARKASSAMLPYTHQVPPSILAG